MENTPSPNNKALSKKFKWDTGMTLTVLFGLTAIIEGILIYKLSNKSTEISYQITDYPSLIYDSQGITTSNIKLYECDSILIDQNVYVLTGVIWNSGDIQINEDNIRKNINLKIGSQNRIIEYNIVSQIDPEVADFSLSKENKNTLQLSWKYFDPNYAVKFQIIYAGDKNSNFQITGKILNLNEFKKITDQKNNQSTSIVGVLSFIIGGIAAVIIPSRSIRRRRRLTETIIIIACIISSLFIIYKLIGFNNFMPPIQL